MFTAETNVLHAILVIVRNGLNLVLREECDLSCFESVAELPGISPTVIESISVCEFT